MTFDDAREQIHMAATTYLVMRTGLFMDGDNRPQPIVDNSEKCQAIDDKYDNTLRDIFRSLSYADQVQIAIDYDKEVFNLMLDDTQRSAKELMK